MPDKPRYPRFKRNWYKVLRLILGLIYNTGTRRHVTGLEHIPEHGPYIMVSNHLSFADPPLIALELGIEMRPLAAEKYERHLFFRPLLGIAGAIFIRRGEVDRKALRQALNVLEDGGIIGIAAEGTRSHTGALIEGKTGAAYLATRTNVLLLPVVVYGTEKAIPNLLKLRRTDVYTVIGRPFRLPEGRANSEQLHAYTEHIMLMLAAMLPEKYRGVYADHPRLPEYLASGTA